MSRLTIYLPEPDNQALKQLALLEFRAPKMQAMVIICAELERQSLLSSLDKAKEESQG